MSNQKILDLLKLHEGFSSSVYKCSEGFYTIGYGRLVDQSLGGGITKDEAEILLNNDVEKCKKILSNKLSFFEDLSENRQIVLIDMYFNLGNRLFKFVNTLAALENKNYNKAANEMLLSKWSKQVGQRAVTLSNMMRDDIYQV
tara:strand:+ start:1097 stop:1525 length:429 start_codon:yes stop_codon:yes gene_type:complete